MRRTRGVLFIIVGLILAGLAGYAVLSSMKEAEKKAAATAAASAAVVATPVAKVFVVIAAADLPENVAISTADVATKEFPAEFAPPDAIASLDLAVGKYTTARVFKGEILVAPLLSDSKRSGALAASIPEGKVAIAVIVNDAMNTLGALRPGDHVDILLSIDLKGLVAVATPTANSAAGQGTSEPGAGQNVPELSTQLTMQNVPILAIGAPAGDAPRAGAQGQAEAQNQGQQQQQQARTITFLLDRQDAVTLKFIKDSGGTMDLVVRSPSDTELAKTEAVTLDTIYRKFSFHFVQPVGS